METTESTHSISIHGHQFGTHDHRVLEDCPIARSLAEIVDSGKPFIWMPNQLPYFVENMKDISVRCKGKTLVAERLDDGVSSVQRNHSTTFYCISVFQHRHLQHQSQTKERNLQRVLLILCLHLKLPKNLRKKLVVGRRNC